LGCASGILTAIFGCYYQSYNNQLNSLKNSNNKEAIETTVKNNADKILKKIDSNIKPEKANTILLKDKAKNSGTIVNSNTGTIINNEFVSGDKVINNKTVVVSQEKLKQRIVNKSDIDKILKTIPKDFLIELKYSFSNKECEKFGVDIANKLTELNYNLTTSIYGQISTNTYDERLEIRLNEQIKKAEIIVHVLQ
jgi:hypothetical protein